MMVETLRTVLWSAVDGDRALHMKDEPHRWDGDNRAVPLSGPTTASTDDSQLDLSSDLHTCSFCTAVRVPYYDCSSLRETIKDYRRGAQSVDDQRGAA